MRKWYLDSIRISVSQSERNAFVLCKTYEIRHLARPKKRRKGIMFGTCFQSVRHLQLQVTRNLKDTTLLAFLATMLRVRSLG